MAGEMWRSPRTIGAILSLPRHQRSKQTAPSHPVFLKMKAIYSSANFAVWSELHTEGSSSTTLGLCSVQMEVAVFFALLPLPQSSPYPAPFSLSACCSTVCATGTGSSPFEVISTTCHSRDEDQRFLGRPLFLDT